MNEELNKYREAVRFVNDMEDRLYQMVNFLVMNTEYKNYHYEKLIYNAPGEKSKLYLWGRDDYDDTLDIPTAILDKYFDGHKDEAKKDFDAFLIKDAEEKAEIARQAKLEAERKAKERAEEAKRQKEIEERQLFEKLKEKYGVQP